MTKLLKRKHFKRKKHNQFNMVKANEAMGGAILHMATGSRRFNREINTDISLNSLDHLIYKNIPVYYKQPLKNFRHLYQTFVKGFGSFVPLSVRKGEWGLKDNSYIFTNEYGILLDIGKKLRDLNLDNCSAKRLEENLRYHYQSDRFLRLKFEPPFYEIFTSKIFEGLEVVGELEEDYFYKLGYRTSGEYRPTGLAVTIDHLGCERRIYDILRSVGLPNEIKHVIELQKSVVGMGACKNYWLGKSGVLPLNFGVF